MVGLRPPVWLESESLFFRSPVSKANSCGDDPGRTRTYDYIPHHSSGTNG
jgi:hypothetical protein